MANITRFDPYGELVSLRSAMDRLFEDSFVSPRTWRTLASGNGIAPAVDVRETPDHLVVSAALPGMEPKDLDVTITGQTLSLRGELKAEDDVEGENYIYRERRFGSFHRTLELPVRVDGDKAQATFRNGVLTLRIPKADEVKPRQIRISAEGNGTTDAVEATVDGSHAS